MVLEEPAYSLADAARDRAERLPAKKQPTRRRYELDWLRVMIILGAMVFHAIYELQIYFPQLRSDMLTTLTQMGVTLSIQWGLPLLLLIAGASAWLSLARRSVRQFVAERVLHLLVPFIGCVLTVIPITLYLASLISSDSHLAFFRFYADYFHGYSQLFRGNPLDQLIPLWDNLWFIFVIVLLSLCMLPLLLLLNGSRGIPVISRFATLCRIPGGTLTVGLIFIVCAWVLGMVLPVTLVKTLWPAALYVLSFIAGVLLYADPAIEHAIARDGMAAILLAALCFGIEQILVSRNALPLPHSGGYVFSAILAGGFSWFGAIGFLGLAKRYFSFANPTLEYLREAAFPYFLLHMLVLSLFGYIFLVHTNLPGVLQGVAIISCSVLSLVLLYEFLIRRNAVLRFLFGLKSRSHS